MADVFTVTKTDRGNKQFQGAFKEMFLATGSCTDQDGIADDVGSVWRVTVPGVVLGDMVLGVSFTASLSDTNAQLTLTAHIHAANTVDIKAVNVDAVADAYNADTLNGSTFKILIGRPNW
jgi:hypothetical protein